MPLRVGVFGAGAIGVFVGGRLAAAGCDVTLVGRPRVLDPIARDGLVIEDLESATRVLPAGRVRCATDATALANTDLVLVTTKAGGTRAAAEAIRASAPSHAQVVSLQNGVDGPATLRDVLGPDRGYGGMIAYNVVFREPTRLRRATSGPLVIERGEGAVAELIAWLRAAGLTTVDAPDIQRVLWSKLLFNLNNALNALSGLPLRTQLRDRGFRRLMATMMREGLAVMRARGMQPMRFGTMYPPLAAALLPVPDFVFERAASAMLAIDPEARSSMADDLAQRRPTEIDALNGTIVRHGQQLGVATPLNARVVEAVRAAERANAGSPNLRAADLAG